MPVLDLFKELNPHSTITIITSSSFAGWLTDASSIDKILVFYRPDQRVCGVLRKGN